MSNKINDDNENTIQVAARVAVKDGKRLDKLIEDGYYYSRSDFVRAAVREKLKKHYNQNKKGSV